MQHSVLRAAPRAFTNPSLVSRPLLRPSRLAVPAATRISQVQQQRFATPHAISGPTLAGIEKRWEMMPPQEQAELWMQLRDRMVEDWHNLTLQEKKACMFGCGLVCSKEGLKLTVLAYWIAFGPHGPRKLPRPGENWEIFWWTMGGCGIAVVLFLVIRMFAGPAPRTMTKEWQEKTNEYLRVRSRDSRFTMVLIC